MLKEEEEDAEEDCKSRANFWLEKAAQQGSSHAKFELWKQSTWSTNDPAVKLQRLRGLRECLPGNKEAELELVMNYASGNTGNLNREMAAMAIRQVRFLTENCEFLCSVIKTFHIFGYSLKNKSNLQNFI